MRSSGWDSIQGIHWYPTTNRSYHCTQYILLWLLYSCDSLKSIHRINAPRLRNTLECRFHTPLSYGRFLILTGRLRIEQCRSCIRALHHSDKSNHHLILENQESSVYKTSSQYTALKVCRHSCSSLWRSCTQSDK